jgi:hypothetical protein
MRCLAHDIVSVSKREITPEGYLKAPAVLGRCGIQVYTRAELGLDGDPLAPVRLMRTPEEVFRPETIASFENKPITYRHPDKAVDSSKWRELAKGHVRDVAKAPGDLLGGTTWVMDAEQVARVVSGDGYLSSGYGFELDMTPGKSSDGQDFDGYQRNILGDHLAILDRVLDSPRGGPICRISDNERKTTMGNRKIAVDGLPPFEIDELAAGTIEAHAKKLTADRDQVVADFAGHVKDSKAQLAAKDATIAEKDKVIAAKDAEIKKLGEDLKTARAIDVDALVTERSAVVADAKKLAPELEVKGSSAAIRRAAVVAACSDATSKAVVDKIVGDSIEKATDAQVSTAFAVLRALPRQAQLAAQDAALAGVLGGTGSSGAANNGSVEIVDLSSRTDICVGAVI